MMKKMALAFVLVIAACALASAAAAAAPAMTNGKILSIDGNKVQIAIDGAKPDWIKKNAPVKFKVGNGKVVEVSEAKVAPVTITVTTPKAADMKVGETISFQKGTSMAGC